ncbi:MAG: AtpZ/AtpI family protein [Phycisphaerales bacterium]|nr:AtpZ/AtpI family protein [Phycisphaerales bacterium]
MPPPDPSSDPRLRIPDVLREPTGAARPGRSVVPGVSGGSHSAFWGMAKAWGIALDFIFTIIAGAALGYGYDYWKKTAPTGLMIGIAIGFVVAFIRIVRSTLKEQRAEEERKGKSPR